MDFEEKFGKQLTEEQAIELAKSGVWKEWSDEEVVRFQLFQEKLCMNFSRFHEAIENVLGRPVFTHEFGINYEGIVKEYLGTKKAPTFDEIINLIPEEKRIIVGV